MVVETYTSWRSHRTIRLGASLAYYGLFAIVPLLAISLAVAGLVISEADVEEFLASVLGNIVDGDGQEFAAQLTDAINSSATASSLGLFGIGSLLLTASLVFVALQDAFDTIWEIPVSGGTWASLRRRLLAFAVVFLAGAFFVASFAVVSISNLIRKILPDSSTLIDAGADLLASVGSVGLLAVVIAALFHFLTRDGLAWKVTAKGFGKLEGKIRDYVVDMESAMLEECVPLTVGPGAEIDDEDAIEDDTDEFDFGLPDTDDDGDAYDDEDYSESDSY